MDLVAFGLKNSGHELKIGCGFNIEIYWASELKWKLTLTITSNQIRILKLNDVRCVLNLGFYGRKRFQINTFLLNIFLIKIINH